LLYPYRPESGPSNRSFLENGPASVIGNEHGFETTSMRFHRNALHRLPPGAVHGGYLIFKLLHTPMSPAPGTTARSELGHDRSHKEGARLQKYGRERARPMRVTA